MTLGLLGLAAPVLLSACGGGHAHVAVANPEWARWHAALHVKQVVDVAAAPMRRGLVVAADGKLAALRAGDPPRRLAQRFGGYTTKRGPEAYIAVSPGQAVPSSGCRFARNVVYALEPKGRQGVVAAMAGRRARRFVDLGGAGLLSGIAFDTTGRFGHRLLVTRATGGGSTVYAIDCRGRVRTITDAAPRVEGGISVAPPGFGHFAGHLIAPDERSGRIFAIGPSGRAKLVADSGLPHGGDIGVESAGFVPHGFGRGWSAYLADRVSPGNPHPGDDELLALGGTALSKVGVRPGDLLVASEGGAQTIAVHCAATCWVSHVANGPLRAHAEGHIAFAQTH